MSGVYIPTNVPVFNHILENDDLGYGGCPYTASYDATHWNDNQTFANDSEYIFPILKTPVGKYAFGYDD